MLYKWDGVKLVPSVVNRVRRLIINPFFIGIKIIDVFPHVSLNLDTQIDIDAITDTLTASTQVPASEGLSDTMDIAIDLASFAVSIDSVTDSVTANLE